MARWLGSWDSKTVTTFTVIAPSRSRPGIPSRNASSGIVSSLRPGAVTSPVGQRDEAVAQGVEQRARSSSSSTSARLRIRTFHVRRSRTSRRCGERVGDDAAVGERERGAQLAVDAAEQDVAAQRLGGVQRGEPVELAAVASVAG